MTAKVQAVEPAPGVGELLAGSQFADAYRVRVDSADLDATRAAQLMFSRQPGWVDGLMRVRDAIVGPLGLKTAHHAPHKQLKTIGMFPIQSATPGRVVLGFDDKHQDFRVAVDVVQVSGGCEVTATTLVRRHNLFGLIYLTTILPFHRLIVRATLRNMASHISDNLS